ncbi:hypothetical protein AEST_22370 [Alishewanella aestuarii B11]|uniref:Uncharacterized protein n=1 Tax=Alishewanella aestuarii B11 TaxID=1197174 RepID=J1YBC4_9ALTE|nr:hypothetical protein AEST_22370 [Alishewanella aestuarii B11]
MFGRFIRGLTKTCNSVTAKVNVRFWHKATIQQSLLLTINKNKTAAHQLDL